ESGSLAAGEYAIICIDSSALTGLFPGLTPYTWTSGALSNGGETITLLDNMDNVLDQVTYDDVPPWPGFNDGTSGNGSSIVLCDPLSDNSLGTSWRASQDATGMMING